MAAELAERLREARAAERERSAILEGMAEAVLSLDSGLRIRFANGAARARFGLPEAGPAEAGRLPGLLEATRSTSLQEAAEACLASGKPLETEFAHYRNGAETWLRLVASPIAAGEGLVLVLDDRTRLRRLERVRRDFVANVSHELRTPIQLVKGFAESLRDGGLEDPGQAARFVSIIQRNANRMESLVEDLLVLARLEQEGGGRLPLEEVVVRDLVREALDAVAPRAEAAGVPLSSEVEEGLAARANGGLLVQALVNLLDNAVKYSPAGSPVLASARREGGLLVLEVRDRGTGIPAADLPRLFERFYRVDRARSRELGGTGLGLAIVRHIALAHGGEVAVESWEGEGSLFRLSLPADGLPGAV